MSGINPNHELAFIDYTQGMKYKAIAEKYNVSIDTVKSWKTRHWNKKGVHTKSKKVCTQKNAPQAPQPPPPHTVSQAITTDYDVEGLTDQQRDFCHCWIRNRNGKIAAINAGYSPKSAHVAASRLLKNDKVMAYIDLFREDVKNMVMLGEAEIVEYHMRIAFADMGDFVHFGVERRPYTHKGRPVYVEDPNDLDEDGKAKQKAFAHDSNMVWVRDSDLVDGQLIAEISQGRDGVKIKLVDRQRSLTFLERYFILNPMDRHRMEYDARKVELELMKIQAGLPPTNDETGSSESNFMEAMKGSAVEVWEDENDS